MRRMNMLAGLWRIPYLRGHCVVVLIWTVAWLALGVDRVHAQEQIDPRTGQLHLTVTDLTLRAGPITIEMQRALVTRPNQQSLLGSRWRSNWESRVVSTPTAIIIQQAPYAVAFSGAQGKREYRSSSGELLVVEGDGRFVRTTMLGTTETFDRQGRLVERDYRNGNKAIVRYSEGGRIARIDGPKGSFIQFSTDNQGHVARVETSTGATVRYGYVGDNLTEVQVNGGPIVRYAYDARGALTRVDDPTAGAAEFAYDAGRRVVSRRWADGAEERFDYDDAANRQRHIDPTGAVTITQWTPDRRRAEVTDPRGGKTVIAFDAAGRPESTTDALGARVRNGYDALGRTVAVEDPRGRVTRFEYLGDSKLPKTITRPDGVRTSLEYDKERNLTAVKVAGQTIASFAYLPDGALGTIQEMGASERRLTYDKQGRLQSSANVLGDKLQLTYDSRGNPLRAVNPLGGVTAWQWDNQDRLRGETDPVGGVTRFEYDSSGRLSRLVDPTGAVRSFEYDARGRLKAETDHAGEVARYEYDGAGRVVKVTDRDGSESYRYDTAGQVTEWRDRLGRSVQLERDLLGRLVRERSSTGLEIRYRHDALGQGVALEGSSGVRFEWERDERGLVVAARDALGAATQYEYDAAGNLKLRRDARGHVTQFAYTGNGALTRVQAPSGDAVEYRYDAASRIVGIVRPSGGTTRLAYDALGNLIHQIDALGHERRSTYDVAGRLTATTDATGRVTRYGYDAAGRLTEKRLPNDKRVAYRYDAVGNLLEADDGAFPIRNQYDTAGRLVRREYPAIKKVVGYEYDAAGLRTRLIAPDGQITGYEYNPNKQLAAIIPPDGKRIGLSYDAHERLKAIEYPNGLVGRLEYDAGGRVAKRGTYDGAGKAVHAWTYRYDADGNLIQQQDSQGGAMAYQYDGAGQLTEATGPAAVERYRYGRGGNRESSEEGGSATQYRHDSADRLIQAGAEQLAYDAHGNLTRRQGPSGTTQYEYDAEHRLIKVQPADGKATTYGYAPTGERVWKRDTGGLTYYLYDGFDLIAELSEQGALQAAYTHGSGIDEPLAMQRDGKSYYYHADALGSIRTLTDERGQVATSYDYGAFGKPSATKSAVANPFTFTAREWDASTGLYYYRARYYDARLGRFLSPDPIEGSLGDVAALNRYAYVRNAPTRYRDPLGLMDDQGVLAWAADWLTYANRVGAQNLTARQQDALALAGTIIDQNHTHGIQSGVRVDQGGQPLKPIKWTNVANAIRTLPKAPVTGQMRVPGPDGPVDPNATTGSIRVAPKSGPPGGSRSGSAAGPIATPLIFISAGRTIFNYWQAPPEDRPHVIATEAGGWIGGMGTPALIACATGATLSWPVALVVGAGGSLVCSTVGGSLVPRPSDIPPPFPGLGGRGPAIDPRIEGPPPPTDRPGGPLTGPVTGGLPAGPAGAPSSGLPPGLVDLSDIPFDPRTAPKLPHPLTPDQIARAGQLGNQAQGGIPGTTQPPGQPTGQTGQPQGGYQGGQEIPGTGTPQQPGQPPIPYDPRYDPRGGGMNVPTPGGQYPRGGTGSGGNTPSTSGGPPTNLAQNPPGSGGQCRQPLCHMKGQKDCEQGPLPDQNGWFAACYANMLSRCNAGEAGATGGWCVHKGADPSCDVRARRVCGGSLAAPGATPPPVVPACGPATQGKCKCPGGKPGHIPCDKSLGRCHCGAG